MNSTSISSQKNFPITPTLHHHTLISLPRERIPPPKVKEQDLNEMEILPLIATKEKAEVDINANKKRQTFVRGRDIGDLLESAFVIGRYRIPDGNNWLVRGGVRELHLCRGLVRQRMRLRGDHPHGLPGETHFFIRKQLRRRRKNGMGKKEKNKLALRLVISVARFHSGRSCSEILIRVGRKLNQRWQLLAKMKRRIALRKSLIFRDSNLPKTLILNNRFLS